MFACDPRQGLESADQEGWQSFDLTSYADQPVSSIGIVVRGTGSGAPGFELLDGNFLGQEVEVYSDTVTVSVPRAEGTSVLCTSRGEALPMRTEYAAVSCIAGPHGRLANGRSCVRRQTKDEAPSVL